MNTWPKTNFDEELRLLWPFDDSPVTNRRFEIIRQDGSIIRGTTDAQGGTGLQKSDFLDPYELKLLAED
ncbi:MAG TPA: hypothetical protein PK620_10535 [Denitromonas sp.]|nr:hypothetical protein [Denitromonas sp.]